MDKEFAETFSEEILKEDKLQDMAPYIEALAELYPEDEETILMMAQNMVEAGMPPDPYQLSMMDDKPKNHITHIIAKTMGIKWTEQNGYGKMRMKQNYPEAVEVETQVKKIADRFKSMVRKEEVEVDEGNARVDRLKMIDKLKMSKLSPKQKKALEKEEVEEAKKWQDYLSPEEKKRLLGGKRQKEGIDIQKADMKDVIKDFQSSDAPQFKGKSDKKRKEMAIAAKLSKEEVEIDEVIGKVLGRAAMIGGKVAVKGAVKGATAIAKGIKNVKKKATIAVATKIAKKQGNKEEVEMEEASKLPPHLAKFFDKKGDLKPEVAARIAKGREKLNIKDVTPKGYGPKEEENEDGDPVGKKKSKDKDYKTKDVINLKPTAESSMKKFKDIMTKLKEKRSSNEEVEMKEEWIDVEARKVEGLRWKKMSTKDRTKWLDRIKKMADKEGMSQEELDDILGKGEYGLTKFDDERVYNKAQLVKPKWKRMSTVQKTKWIDDLHDLAGKTNTSDADVESILDDAKLKIKESVEEATGDKEAYQKFFNGALKKFGVKSPSQLKGDKKKEFFDYVDKNWKADHEEQTKKEETMTKKSLKDAVSHMKEKKSKVDEAITIGGIEVGEQDFDKESRLDHVAPNLGMTYKDYQAKFETNGMEGPYQIDGGAYMWDKIATKWFSVESEDYVDDKRNAELNFRYTKQGTAGGGLMHTRRF